jgi:O-antigen ligase
MKLCLYSFLAVSVVSLICQNSRGFWVATLAAALLMLAFHHRHRYKSAMILLVFIVAGILFVFLGQFGVFDQVPVLGRLYSTFVFDVSEPSNYMRAVQFDNLLAKIAEHPVIGSGYGAMIYGYYDSPVFELDYLALIMKIGFVGFIYWAGLMVYLLRDAFRSYFLCGDDHLRTVQMSFIFALISVFILSATNPYLYGILGNFCVVLAIIIFNIVKGPGERKALQKL